MLPDDIPIQGPNGDSSTAGGGGLSSTGASTIAGQLVSISEESDGEPRPVGRSSKDTTKVHKVPFLAFKTSKDKDKNNGLPLMNAASDAKDGSSIVSKSAHKKEKFSNRVSSSSLLVASGDSTDAVDKVSPLITRQKSSQSDLATTATNGVEGLSLQLLSNGGQAMIGNGEGLKTVDSLNNSLDGMLESMDSSPDAPSQRTSIIGDVKSHMQVSQV